MDVIPDLLEDTNVKQSIKEVVAACCGVLLMIGVAKLEHMDQTFIVDTLMSMSPFA